MGQQQHRGSPDVTITNMVREKNVTKEGHVTFPQYSKASWILKSKESKTILSRYWHKYWTEQRKTTE